MPGELLWGEGSAELLSADPLRRPHVAGDVGKTFPSDLDSGRELDAATRAAVEGLRGFGYSWGQIASRLGTRQAAQQRWGR